MRALRTLFFGMPFVVMLELFALPPVVATGGAAYAAENSPGPPKATAAAAKPAGSAAPGPTAAAPQEQNPADLSDDAQLTTKPGPLPLSSPVQVSAQCPAAPLPPHVQKLCAQAAAQLEALRAAAALLPNRRDIRMGITDANERTALAAELYTPLIEDAPAPAGSDGTAGAQGIAVTLLARPDAAETLMLLLRNPDVLLVRQMLLADLAGGIALARQVAQKLAETNALKNITPGSGGTWYKAKVTEPGQLEQNPPLPPAPDARHEARQAALRAADDLTSHLSACLGALDTLHLAPQGWLTTAAAMPQLEKAAADLPGSAALQLLAAEAQLQSGMPQRSIVSSTAALALAPGLARARYIRALAQWRLQQLALAEDDLAAALDATPEAFVHTADRVRLLRARGALRMLRNNTQGMCSDLTAACALGDCEGLAAARDQQFCLTAQPPETPAPADKALPTAGGQGQPAANGQTAKPSAP